MSAKPFAVVLAELAKPFDPELVEFKAGALTQDKSRALALAYVDARAYQARLDEVAADWSNTYQREYADGRVIVTCALTIGGVTRQAIGEALLSNVRSDGTTVVEENAATAAEAQAFKRACAAFGLGRYLYAVPQVWADYDVNKRQFTPAAVQALRAMLRNGNGTGNESDGNGDGNGHNGNGHNGSGDATPAPVAAAPAAKPVVVSAPTAPTQSPTPAPTPAAAPNGAKVAGPACPKCGGPMWDNRASKKNPKAPDYRCKNSGCDGVIWPTG